MGDVCRLSWQLSERGAIRSFFFIIIIFFPLVWLTARDSLSVWTVSLKDERHYHDCVQAAKGVHTPVLTATWQTVLSSTLRRSIFASHVAFYLKRFLSRLDVKSFNIASSALNKVKPFCHLFATGWD